MKRLISAALLHRQLTRLGFIVLTLSSGCGMLNTYLAGSDNTTPPTPLTTIENRVTVQSLWNASTASSQGAFVRLQPAIHGNRVFVASRGQVAAFDRATGQTLWLTALDQPITAGTGLTDDLVLVGTGRAQVIALHQEDGREVWRAPVSSEVLATPRGDQGIVVVRAMDGQLSGLNARTGERLWLYSTTVPALTLRGSAAPLVGRGVAIIGLDNGKLLVLSLQKGIPVFEKTLAPPRGRTELERLVDMDSEPRIVGGVLYIAAYQGNVSAIDPRTGNTLWNKELSSYAGLDADGEQVYVVDSEGVVWGLDAKTGRALWKQAELTGRRLSTPVVHKAGVVVGDFEGYLHWLDKDSGKLIGRVRADSTAIRTAPVIEGDTLFVLSEGGRLSAFRADRL